MKRLLCICLILVLILPLNTDFAPNRSLVSNFENESIVLAYGSHAPIAIISDADFATQASGEGWVGSGTSIDPYIIEEYTIDATGTCISISDVTVPFVIRNCDLNSTLDGISLTNVNNCTAYNITFTDHSSQGLYAMNSFCTVYNCTFTDNFLGVTLEDSPGCNITDNTFTNCGVEIIGAADYYWNHEIQLNTVNGQLLGYFWNDKDTVIDGSSYGQVILANCTNVTVQLGNFTNLADAILLGYSDDCTIFNNTVHDTTRYGIYSQYSASTYTNNTIYGNIWGIYLRFSEQSMVANNTVYENTRGLMSSFSAYSEVRNNDIFDNVYGVFFFASPYCNFSNNYFTNDGVYFEGGNDFEHHQYFSGDTVNGIPIGNFWGLRDDSIDLSPYGQVLVGNCTGTTFFGGEITNTSFGVYMSFSADNIIQDTVVNNSKFGLYTYASPNVEIRNSRVYNCQFDAFISVNSDNASVIDCQASGNRYGSYITSSANCSILRSNFTDNTDSGIALFTTTLGIIIECNISFSGGYGIELNGADNFTILDNSLGENGIHLYSSKNNIISSNLLDKGSIFLAQTDNPNCIITHNQIIQSGIEVHSSNCTIYNNTIIGSIVTGAFGMHLRYSQNIVVERNTIYNHLWWGLYVLDCNDTVISNNEIYSNQQDGIVLERTNHSLVMENNVTGNAHDGIQLSDAHHNDITNNMITGNSYRGFLLDTGSSDNTIVGNVIGWNVAGTATDDGASNNWDNGVDRGNQWSDYGGSGTYSITGFAGSIDNYPSVIAPYIVPIADFERNSPEIRLTWESIGVNPDAYTVFVEGSVWEQGTWDGWSVSSTVSFLSYGLYNITLSLTDTNGNSTSSTIHYNFISGYVVHSPIIITSDTGFADMATTESWAGDGTQGDPYIIEGYNITHDGRCIGIFDVNVHFIIRNCHLTSNGHRAVYGHGTIRGPLFSSGRTGDDVNNDGIDLSNINNATIFNNTIIGNLNDAINAYNSKCLIINNTIQDSDEGIHLLSCSGSIMANNSFENCGIRLSGSSLSHLEHEVQNNYVHGKEIGYYFGISDMEIDGSLYGEIILVNSRNITIIDGVFSNSSIGVLIGFSTECELRSNTFSYNSIIGLDIGYSNNTIIANNSFHDNYYALFLRLTQGCTVANNTMENDGVGMISHYPTSPDPVEDWHHLFSDNTVNGKPLGYFWDEENLILDADDYGQVILANCRNIIVQNGEISHTSEAIVVSYSENCSFTNLSLHDNILGTWIDQSGNSTIQDCTIFENLEIGCLIIYSGSSQILNNLMYGNAVGAAGSTMGYCIISGNTARNNSFSGIRFQGSYNLISNNTVYGNSFEAQWIGTLDPALYVGGSIHCTILNNTLYENYGRGIEVPWGHHNNITQNTVYKNAWYPVRIAGEYGVVTNNVIYDNGFWGLSVTEDHSWIEGNTIYNHSQYGIYCVGQNITVIDNEVSLSGITGITIGDSSNCTLLRNVVYDNVQWGISINNCPGIQVSDNTIYDNMHTGLSLARSNNSEVSNNSIFDNHAGMTLQFSSFVSAFANEISGTYSDAGVFIQICNEVNLTWNKIFQNNFGISISRSNSCLLSFNMVYENTLYGIQITTSGSQNNLLYGNIIAWNLAGNAVDHGTLNSWNSVTGIGNQWSDYSGTGVYEIPGNANSTDNYPLVVAPTIEPLSPFDTDESTIDVTWTAMGVHSDTYVVFLNDIIFDSAEWDGWSITVEISLDIRDNNLTLFVNDTDGNSAAFSVFITYTGASTTTTTTTTSEPPSTTTPTPPDGEPWDPMLIVLGAGVSVIIILVAFVVFSKRRRAPDVPPDVPTEEPPEPAPVIPIAPEEPEEPEEVFEGVQVLRGCAPVGGKFEYKVKIKNDTPYVIHSVTVTIVDYPRDCMELSGESTKRLEKIEPRGFRSPQFSFIPTKDCVEGQILSSVSYVNYQNDLESIEVEPIVIRSVCDLLEPLETTMEEFELLLGDMSVTREEREMEWNPEVLYAKAEKLLPNRNFHVLEAESSSQEGLFRGIIRGLAEGKYTRKKVAVRIVISGRTDAETSHVIIEGLGEDSAMLPTTIEEITSAIDAWICLKCGGGLDTDAVTLILSGQPVECQYCKSTMTIHLYRKQ